MGKRRAMTEITEETWNSFGGIPELPRVASDSFIGIRLSTIEVLLSIGNGEMAERFSKELKQVVYEERFFRSVGRAANLGQLMDDVESATRTGQDEFAAKLIELIGR